MRPPFGSLADAVLVLHAIVVVFNIGALPVIWIGYLRGWAFVRNFYFRVVHLLLIGVVAAESLFGIWCPLTTWEASLRSEPMHQNSFIAHWLHKVLFYDFPAWVFSVAYLLFFVVAAGTFYFCPVATGRFRANAGLNEKQG